MKKIVIAVMFLGAMFSPNSVFAQTENTGRQSVYRATHTKTTELKHTKLKVKFDFEKEQMAGEEWLTASPYFYPSDSLVLNAKSMLIHEVALDKKGAKTPLKYEYKNDLLHINLDKIYNRNQDYTIYIKYTARPNEVKADGSAAISDAKGLYFINAQGKEEGKPTQIWTQGQTESNSVWFPTIDKPNQKTTQEIYMTVPDKFVTLSNGLMKSSVKEAGGLRTDHWVMDKKHAPYLFFMGVGDYAVIKDKWRDIPVDYYVEKEYAPYAKQIFGHTPEMMEFFSKQLKYDYPWQKYSQMVSRDYVSGAMENTTAVIHAEQAQQKAGQLIDKNHWEDTIAHELYHHWFGDLVTAESWSNLTVNESFATYSHYLWNEYKYGKDAADYGLWLSLRGYFGDPSNISKDLVRFNYHSREDMFDGVSYNKGGGILHMLRNYLGDEAFFNGLSDYLKTNEYGTGEAHQLRLSLEKVSGKDLNWFFNQWFFGSGHPKLDVKYSIEPVKKEVSVNINQSGKYFEFPLAIDVYEGGKSTRHQVWVEAKEQNIFTFKFDKKPNLVNVNADGVLLAEINNTKTAEEYLHQYTHSKDLKSRLDAIRYAGRNYNPTTLKILLAGLKDPYYQLRIMAIDVLDLSKPEVVKLALPILEKMAQADPKTLAQAKAIGALASLGDKKYLPIFEKGLKSPSFSVQGNSAYGIAKVSPEKMETILGNIDLENADTALLTLLLPTIVENKMEKFMPAIGEVVAFYPFREFDNPEIGKHAKAGFNWIMDSDNTKAVSNITNTLLQIRNQVKDNVGIKKIFLDMLKAGLERKLAVLRANPKSESLNKQVDLLNKAIEAYK
ncbi:MAG: M1 family aminopeptidase [Flavobacteriaceae bacterium]|nr:M1 family aminopeptidase [Flavobacteriaceae bacterium]